MNSTRIRELLEQGQRGRGGAAARAPLHGPRPRGRGRPARAYARLPDREPRRRERGAAAARASTPAACASSTPARRRRARASAPSTNVGRRPTFGAAEPVLTEAHLLDFARRRSTAGASSSPSSTRLREERRFPDVEALRAPDRRATRDAGARAARGADEPPARRAGLAIRAPLARSCLAVTALALWFVAAATSTSRELGRDLARANLRRC